MSEQLTAWLNAAGVVIGGLVGLWGLASAVARPARLRREEAQWRGLLEAGTCLPEQRRLIEDLHREVTAQLLSLRLNPPYLPFARPALLLLGSLLAVLLGVLTAAVGVDVERAAGAPRPVWILLGGLLVGAPITIGAALVPIAEEVNARNGIARRLLDDELPVAKPPASLLASFRSHHHGQPAQRRRLRTTS